MTDGLAGLRRRIDAIDARVLALLTARAALVHRVFAQKVRDSRGGSVRAYVPAREAEVLRRLGAGAGGGFSRASVQGIFREVISACRALEQPTRAVAWAPLPGDARAAVHAAFGHQVELFDAGRAPEALAAVARGKADYAVLPFPEGRQALAGDLLPGLFRSRLAPLSEIRVPDRRGLDGKAPERRRYFVWGLGESRPTGEDRTAVACRLPVPQGRPALPRGLRPLSVVWSSRPGRVRDVFVELKGAAGSAAGALAALRRHDPGARLLGSYPAAV